MIKRVIKGMAALVSVAIIGACAANTISGARDSETFGVLGNESGSMQGFGKGHHNMFMKGFIKDLTLTEDQKAKFKALKEETKTTFDKDKMKGNREAFKNVLKEAFLSNSINKADLKAKLEALKPQDNGKSLVMANNLIKAYNILTTEQRNKIETKINDMENKFQSMSKSPMSKMFGFAKNKRFDWLTNDLNLTEAQKTDLKALMEPSETDKTQIFEKMKSAKNTIIAELKSGNPNADKIASVLKDARTGMESKMDSKLDMLVKLHDTLNADQRQKLVNKVENMMSKMKNHKGGHGRSHNKGN